MSGTDNILQMWRRHYQDLFNCVKGTNDVNSLCNQIFYCNDIVVSNEDVVRAVKQLDMYKSCALDGLYAEHLKYYSNRVIPMIAMCSTIFLYMTCYLHP